MRISPQNFMLLATAATGLFFGASVLLQNSRRLVNRIFAVFVFGSVVWIAGIAMLDITGNFFFDKVILYGGVLLFLGIFLLAEIFPDVERVEKRFWWYLIPFAILFLLIPFNVFITGARINAHGFLEPQNGPAFPLLAGTLLAYAVASLVLLLRKLRTLRGRARLQMQYLLTGAVLFVGAVLVCDVLLPAFGVFQFNTVGPMTVILFIGLNAYAIARHQLLEIRVVLQRSLIYSGLFGVILAGYLLVVFVLSYVLQEHTALRQGLLGGLVTTVIGIVGLPTVEGYFRKKTDRFFFKDGYDYTEAIGTLSETVHTTLRLGDLVRAISQTLSAILKPQKIVLFLAELAPQADLMPGQVFRLTDTFSPRAIAALSLRREPLASSFLEDLLQDPKVSRDQKSALEEIQAAMASFDADIILPIVSHDTLIAVLALGAKLSGDPYTTEDLKLLKTFSYQAATALKNAELFQQVQDYSKDLEEKVRERTEVQRQMLVDMWHNLQTPLALLKNDLETVRQKIDTAALANFERLVDDVSRFINGLLKVAKLEAALDAEELKPTNLSALIGPMVQYIEPMAEGKRITIIARTEPGLWILGDENKLKEVLTNLLSNAIKYMQRSKRREIRVSLQRRANSIELAIEDTGRGISAGDVPNLFTRFHTVKTGGPMKNQGTGLGLAICKRIVDRHRGTIAVASAVGKGTTFTLRFPAIDPPETPANGKGV
jgi:signal transduction histidine kinase